jgi:hypothetical protein
MKIEKHDNINNEYKFNMLEFVGYSDVVTFVYIKFLGLF